MKISVVMASFNSAGTIRYAIKSFLAQRHLDKELLVVDGGSRDETIDIVKSFGSPSISWVSEKDGGIYDAMNKGLARAQGAAVGCLNSDDAFHDADALACIADALSGADVAYGDLSMVKDHVGKVPVRTWRAGTFTRPRFHLGWMPPHPTFYVRKPVIDQVGKFDLRYKIASDYDFMLRVLMLHDFRVHYISRTLVDFQVGGVSSSGMKSVVKSGLECLDSRRRHLNHHAVDLALLLKPASRIFQIHWFNRHTPRG